MRPLSLLILVALVGTISAQEPFDVTPLLKKEILPAGLPMQEVQRFLEARVPRLPEFKDRRSWEAYAAKLRADILDKVVYRGEAAKWRDAKVEVKWFDVEPGGPGYRIQKLRFEALPELWVPALLYIPEKLTGKVPATLNVMGHDPKGKDVAYQQIRCINLAKRGMLALNVEWFRFGQLAGDNYHHGRMNQLDLCGTSGLAPFYLSLQRSLDVLLAHPHADPTRVAVSGLSGGGWQTIWISALDTRVTATNPVAGYSSFLTRVRHHKDLGDSEQTPCDFARYADYAHLTALLAPRAALLTFNAKDDCCFEAGYALPPLLEAAGPFYRLYGKGEALRPHVNHVPGTHNYEQENREAFYKLLGDFFRADNKHSAAEMPAAKEVKPAQELRVPMPKENQDFNSLALGLCQSLPRNAELPAKDPAAWQKDRRALLKKTVQYHDYDGKAQMRGKEEQGGVTATYWRLELDQNWTIPVVELVKGQPQRTTLLLSDTGRRGTAAEAAKRVQAGERVLVLDPFYLGEQDLGKRAYLFALFVGAVGERPLGLQASQIAAVARWSRAQHKDASLRLVALGELSSLQALTVAALEEKAVTDIELHKSLGSLKEVLERNLSYDQRPEYFCFGLLEHFDILQLAALVAPRPLRLLNPTERQRAELAGLAAWYQRLGKKWDPLP